MKLDLGKLGKNKREAMLISVLIVAVVLTAYFYIFFRPVIKRLSTLLPEVSMLKADLLDARYLISNRAVIEREEQRLNDKMDEFRKIFPSQREVPKLLENLSAIAAKSGVRILGIRPLSGNEDEDEKKQREVPLFD